jgi:hypothetical protein
LNMEWHLEVGIQGHRSIGHWYADGQPVMGRDSSAVECRLLLESNDPAAPLARDIARHRCTASFTVEHPGFETPPDPGRMGTRCAGYASGASPFNIDVVGGILEPDSGFLRDAGLYWVHFQNSDVQSAYSTRYYDIRPYCELPYGCALFDVACVHYDSDATLPFSDKRMTGAMTQWLSVHLPLVPGDYVDREWKSDKGIVVRYSLSTVGPECPDLCLDYGRCTSDRCEEGVGCVHEPLSGTYDFDPHDCYKSECYDGNEATVPDDSEVPPQEVPDRPCVKQVCLAGGVVEEGDPTESPPQEPNNCSKEICDQYGVQYLHDPTDVIQRSPHDCTREVCQTTTSTVPVSIPDDSETPIQIPDNGHVEVCRGGRVVLVPE